MHKQKGKILIVDDDAYVALSLKMYLEQHFEEVTTIHLPDKIPSELQKLDVDVVLLDMNFQQGESSGKEGMKWLKKIVELSPDTSVILMTAYGDINLAVEAIKEGASDFLVKPWQNEKLLATANTAYKLNQEKRTVKHLRSKQKYITNLNNQYADFIGQSAEMKSLYKEIEKVATTDANVLILGANGTGKELAAKAVHRNSHRFEEVFITVDLGAVSETLFESELFGHKKGAFTDAKEDRIGRFEAASGGTIFLDEIGNLPLPLQAKLLTVLQNRKITRLGTNEPIDIDVRVICATNGNLKTMVKEGTFREDLLYRINTVAMQLPALKERIDDIPLLVEHFLKTYCKKYQKESIRIPEYVITKLQSYHWPGNIRELQHAIERAVIMSDGGELQSGDFLFLSQSEDSTASIDNYNLEGLEEWAVKNAVKKHRGNISHAAKELGLSRGAMYRRMEKYDL
jgi:DNA-binding NtrC family response regulator